MSLYYWLTNGSMKCFEYILCLLLSVGILCASMLYRWTMTRNFFFYVDICQAVFCLSVKLFFKLGLYPLLHIVFYACKMFPFEQIIHNRIRGGLKTKRKSEAS